LSHIQNLGIAVPFFKAHIFQEDKFKVIVHPRGGLFIWANSIGWVVEGTTI